MGTLYQEVYTVFQSQISDMEFNSLTYLEDLQRQYLKNSIPKFRRCKADLNDRDDSNSMFNNTLTLDEVLILGNLMIVEYLSSQIISLENIKQVISTKDFSMTSQANHLEKLQILRDSRKKEISKMIVDYSYTFGDIKKLK